jgi:hypothetical protein
VIRCPRCQRENPHDAKFCGECGGGLEAMCPGCRAANPPGNKFCPQCGGSLATSDPSALTPLFPESYTPKHVAEKILTSQAALEGERKQVTVLFADLEGRWGCWPIAIPRKRAGCSVPCSST